MSRDRRAQLTLDMRTDRPQGMGRSDFFISTATEAALRQIDTWSEWVSGRLCLIGPEGSGKSHLAAIWAADAAARRIDLSELDADVGAGLSGGEHLLLEDADRISADEGAAVREAALLRILNILGPAGGRILLTARQAPTSWAVRLPDLASRLQAFPIARLSPPDEEALTGVFAKLFADRQMRVAPDVIDYLLQRTERSYAGAVRTADDLDKGSLGWGGVMTTRRAGEILGLTQRRGSVIDRS